MRMLKNQKAYEQLLELKFRLKRKAHINPLTELELKLLESCEQLLEINSGSQHFITHISDNPNFMVG